MSARTRTLALLGVVAALVAGAAAWARWGGEAEDDDSAAAPTTRETIVLAVLDTVRADHTSLCGYGRPTTPTLEKLAKNGRHTCRAYAPGSWTLPTHASMFTGKLVLDHGVHELPDPNPDPTRRASAIPSTKLGEVPTLAGRMGKAGYQTVAISGNPVVGKGTNLLRGFRYTEVAKKIRRLDDDVFVKAVRNTLEKRLDPDGGPLFLFLNFADSHQPWDAVPSGVDWVPPRDGLGWSAEDDGEWQRYLTGQMPDDEAKELLAQVTDLYDWGVYRSDRTLGQVLDYLDGEGWCEAGCRVIAVSDHGEFLGEHGLVDHGFYAWEENARVFLVDSRPGDPFPEPINLTHVYHLVKNGKLPEELFPVASVAWPHSRRAKRTNGLAYASTSAAGWTGWNKLLWMDGTTHTFDLSRDPGEQSPTNAEPDAALKKLVKGVDAVTQRMIERRKGSPGKGADEAGGSALDGDEGVMEALKAAGYIE